MRSKALMFAASLLIISLVGMSNPAAAEDSQGMFYCQDDISGSFWGSAAINDEDGSIIADDLSDEFAGMAFDEGMLYVMEWYTEEWIDPTGVYISVWNAACPPGDPTAPDNNIFVPWAEVIVLEEFYRAPPLPNVMKKIYFSHESISDAMSIAYTFDRPAPGYYIGPVRYPTINNECEMHIHNKDIGGWLSYSEASGRPPADLLLCLGYEGIVAADAATWGHIKALYR
jgi:hypothetical protein